MVEEERTIRFQPIKGPHLAMENCSAAGPERPKQLAWLTTINQMI